MDSQTKAQYEAQSQELRAQLKTWENDWAKSHDGSKPSRNDIKQNPDIALKYKQYNKLRDILAGKIPPSPAANSHKRKPSDTLPPQTPSKRPRPAQTPKKAYQHLPADLPGPPAEITTPTISRQLFSPTVPTSIGPTPQRDGRVLGLFDLLGKTPSQPSPSQAAATPSSRRNQRIDKTPVTGNRFRHIAGMTTPLNERQGNGLKKTPSTGGSGRVSKLQFATPAFLRRRAAPPLDVVDENGEWKVGPLRLPKKPLGRSLSGMVAGLRKMEEEAAEDDLDALREMEMEAEGLVAPKPVTKPAGAEATEKKADDEAEVGDSQVVAEPKYKPEKPVLLGGFDDENAYDSSEEEQLDRGQPLRVYKKKGQKRTTRRSNLKPTRAKRPAAVSGEQEDSGEEDDDVVPETQFDTTKAAGNDDLRDELLSGSDFDDLAASEEEDEEVAKKKTKKSKAPEKAEPKKKEGVVKQAVRKVKATAHANFKRLKLRNTGSKGGPAHNSRFRRKR